MNIKILKSIRNQLDKRIIKKEEKRAKIKEEIIYLLSHKWSKAEIDNYNFSIAIHLNNPMFMRYAFNEKEIKKILLYRYKKYFEEKEFQEYLDKLLKNNVKIKVK